MTMPMMIYGVRTNDTSRAVVRIGFKGFEISIAMDDGHRGRDLTRTMISVYKGEDDVTGSLGLNDVTIDGIIDPTGEGLFEIMQAINALEPSRTA